MSQIYLVKRTFFLVLCAFIGFGYKPVLFAASHHPEEFLKSIRGTKDEGAKIVQHICATCHAKDPMIRMGAPRDGSKADWDPRLKQGLQALFQHTAAGINAMPARGGCFECTDRQLKLAILAMLPKEAHPNHDARIK